MLIPVRCFSCGKVTGNKWARFQHLSKLHSKGEALKMLGIRRYCCRQIFICNYEFMHACRVPNRPSSKQTKKKKSGEE